jgi:hypothetical protein
MLKTHQLLRDYGLLSHILQHWQRTGRTSRSGIHLPLQLGLPDRLRSSVLRLHVSSSSDVDAYSGSRHFPRRGIRHGVSYQGVFSPVAQN